MSPPGTTPTTEAVSASESERCEGVPDLSTMKARMNYLVDELGVTQIQAHKLIRAYELDERDRAVRQLVVEEFGPWLRRRGDLLVVRGKAQHAWRVTSG